MSIENIETISETSSSDQVDYDYFPVFENDYQPYDFFFSNELANIPETENIIHELFSTENDFIRNKLEKFQQIFLLPLSKQLSYELSNMISINFAEIRVLHSKIYNQMRVELDGGKGRSNRICQIFNDNKIKLIKIYSYYFANLEKAIKCINSISDNKSVFYNKWEAIRLAAGTEEYRIDELIKSPFFRLVKYPLFFKRLSDHKKDNQIIKNTIKNLEEILEFINVSRRDCEEIDKLIVQTLNSKHISGIFGNLDLKKYGRLIDSFEVMFAKGPNIHFKDKTKKYLIAFETQLIIISLKYVYIDSLLIDENLKILDIQQINGNQYEKSFVDSNLKKYNFYIKTDQLNKMDSFSDKCMKLVEQNKLISKINNNSHKLLLVNCQDHLTTCSICNKYLNGLFFQGLKCSNCFKFYHKQCLITTFTDCEFKNSFEITLDSKYIIVPYVEEKYTMLSNEYKYITKALIKQTELDNTYLNYDTNDYLFVTESLNDNLSSGFKLCFNNYANKEALNVFKQQQGKINTASHVDNSFEKCLNLDLYSWYLVCDKEKAVKLLERIEIQNNTNIFMIRHDNEKENYRLTIKYNKDIIKHLEIENEQIDGCFYYKIVKDNKKRCFKSIPDLVNYFRLVNNNSLSECTNGAIHVLETPYREALPLPIYIALAKYDFEGLFFH
jgi:hypothetical protein